MGPCYCKCQKFSENQSGEKSESPNSSIYGHHICTASHILILVPKYSPFVDKSNDVRIIELCIIDLSIFLSMNILSECQDEAFKILRHVKHVGSSITKPPPMWKHISTGSPESRDYFGTNIVTYNALCTVCA